VAKIHECVVAAVDGASPTWWSVDELYELERVEKDELVKIDGRDVYVVKTKRREDE
jgi:hypothetical protein